MTDLKKQIKEYIQDNPERGYVLNLSFGGEFHRIWMPSLS